MAAAGWRRGPAIGRGSTATVSLASTAASGDFFAVKSAELSCSALLQREQSILSALDSPTVVSYVGYEVSPVAGGAVFYNLFLEYAPGGSLADHIRERGGQLNELEISLRTGEILAGISYLHEAGVVHCDIKPANVLIGIDGTAKIGDLGCARWLAAGEKEIRGTPMYMAPEAARGEEQGTPADVWALGCTVIEMATGRPPWPEEADATAGVRRIGFSGDVPEIPAWFSEEAKDFVGNCLRTDPEKRWTAEKLLLHPFIKNSSSKRSRISPKSALDLSFWDAMEEDDEEEEESGDPAAAAERFRGLAAAAGIPNWSWDEEWIDVRSDGPGERTVTENAVAGGEATSVGEERVLEPNRDGGNSCEGCKLDEGNCEMISHFCKIRIVGNCNKNIYLVFLIGFQLALSFCSFGSCLVLFEYLESKLVPNGEKLGRDT
ncbi:Mitogen-activated protein kinase kinase kinase NPK1 [Apostasia shenzhenica]|uniref:Mitogen-activated protein kinase kinase kinase NPK1 n=1 Tax=Apostasia shenzhenica TaxID=1088818 RepID=A0A2I0B3X1_9ASPA|nr:Mitogen-activated protein kinase kinase kinase NPK1 [Apostasia shenzhenica]